MFTYGPLGFLAVPAPFYGASSVAAVVATGAVYFALTATLVVLASRLVPLWAAALVALVVARFYPFLPPFEAVQALAFVWGVEAVLATPRASDFADDYARSLRRRGDVLALTAGLAAAALVAGKLNVGAFAGGLLFVAAIAVARPWWRGAVLFAIAAGVGLAAIWVLTGQALANLPAFVGSSLEIVRGYSEAMVVDTHPTVRWVYAAFALLIGLIGWVAWLAIGHRDRRTWLAVAALGAILAFAEWKTAFTRNFTFYAMVTALVAVFPFASRLRGPDRRTVAAFAGGAALVASLATARADPLDLVDVRGSLRAVAGTAAAVLPWSQAGATERTRAELRAGLAIPEEVLAQLRGQTVHIDPWQTVAAAAYPELVWRPLPVLQSYSAYTTALDELNASAVRSPDRAPARILRERVDDADGTPLAVDRRFVWFEQPATTLEILCRYDELAANDRWQVLGRTERTCGEPERLATIAARAGETVTVPPEPRPDRFVVVRVTGFPEGPLDRLQALLFRADEWYVELSDRGRFRLVPGTADDGLLLAVPGAVAFGERFAFGPPISSLAVSAGRYGERSDATLTFDFLSVPLRATRAGR